MNLRELFSKYPLGCESFSAEWLRRWHEVGRLLDAKGVRECQLEASGAWYAADHGSVAQLLRQGTMYDKRLARRIVLLDGTIVKEWGAE